jgi:hypothetical protein
VGGAEGRGELWDCRDLKFSVRLLLAILDLFFSSSAHYAEAPIFQRTEKVSTSAKYVSLRSEKLKGVEVAPYELGFRFLISFLGNQDYDQRHDVGQDQIN